MIRVTAGAQHVTGRAPARERISWALYDFANTIFSMNMATLFFSAWLVADLNRSNTLYATVNGIASVMVVLSIPLFGAISDATQRRKPWVVGFTIVSCAATIFIAVIGERWLPLVGEGVTTTNGLPALGGSLTLPLLGVLFAFIVANYAYQGAQPFYSAMLPDLVPRVLRSIPYAGTGGRVATFVPTAVLFLLFSLPLFVFCRDHHALPGKKSVSWRQALRDVRATLDETKKYPGSLRFILTSFLYQDAMGTIVSGMALYAIYAMGFAKGTEATVFLVLTIPAVVGSYLIGKIVDRIGPKKTLSLVLLAWVVLLTAMIAAPSRTAFWVVGAFIGLIYGGVQTAERPLLLTLIPAHEAGRFFSFMVLSSRAAAVVGPFVWAGTIDHLLPTHGPRIAYRAGVATVAIAMVLALWMLQKVPDRHGQ